MCGICGIVAPSSVSPDAVVRATRALAHRGPDDEGFLFVRRDGDGLAVDPFRGDDSAPDVDLPHVAAARPAGCTVALGHRRLAILDLSAAGHQPMCDPRGDLWLVFNGEIYNYRELRAELQRLGHSFRTTGDTEVVLSAYAQWGRACFQRFAGMWALAILDRREKSLTLSRDRFGIKPLYWTVTDGRLLFASEIKSLFASGLTRPVPHEEKVARYLITSELDVDEATFFAGVHQLPSASTAIIDLSARSLVPRAQAYWSLPRPDGSMRAVDGPVAVRAAFERSLRQHLRSDAAVGTCLSGGVDSSGIVAVADTLRECEVDATFTHAAFGYVPPEPEHSERRYMDAVAQRCVVKLTYVAPTSEEFISALPAVIASQDEPFGSASIVAQWFVFRAASRAGIKVMLDGQGADEVFGGYHGYLTLIARSHVMSGKPLAFARFARACRVSVGRSPYPYTSALVSLLPGALRSMAIRARRACQAATPPGAYLTPALCALASDSKRSESVDVDAMLRDAVEAQSLPGLLRYEDRNSMAHSIEARVPYLDHRLVEVAFSMPVLERISNAMPKQVLREALRDVLPPTVLERRDKIGFRASPSVTWELARRHREALIEARSEPEDHWFVPDGIARLIESPARDAATEFALWRMINAKLWARNLWGDHSGALT
ncbi:MAG: asparagine synthase (glutamine-hydrolyzing) [Solirubrobacteraceae bacterium]